VLDGILKRFAQEEPSTVLARLTLQRALSPEWRGELFEAHRAPQDTRERLFTPRWT